jgi:tetratricopeptide (TPR) repeat protein
MSQHSSTHHINSTQSSFSSLTTLRLNTKLWCVIQVPKIPSLPLDAYQTQHPLIKWLYSCSFIHKVDLSLSSTLWVRCFLKAETSTQNLGTVLNTLFYTLTTQFKIIPQYLLLPDPLYSLLSSNASLISPESFSHFLSQLHLILNSYEFICIPELANRLKHSSIPSFTKAQFETFKINHPILNHPLELSIYPFKMKKHLESNQDKESQSENSKILSPNASSPSEISVGRLTECAYIEHLLSKLNEGQILDSYLIEIQAKVGMGKSTFLKSLLPLINKYSFNLLSLFCVNFLNEEIRRPTDMLSFALLNLSQSLLITQSSLSSLKYMIQRKDIHLLIHNECMPQPTSFFILAHIFNLPLLDEEQSALSHYTQENLWQLKHQYLIKWLNLLTQKRKICLIIEDIHWLDLEGFILIQTLLKGSNKIRNLLIIATSRPHIQLGSRDPDLKPYIQQLQLQPLNIIESRALAQNLTFSKRLPWQINNDDFINDHWIESCILQAQGHPLFLTQLLHNPPSTHPNSYLPQDIHKVLLVRYKKLSMLEQEFLKYASCLGRIFNPYRLSTIFSLDHQNTHSSINGLLHKLQSQNFINQDTIQSDETLWQFSHALVQDSIYQSLNQTEQIELHQNLASCFLDHPEIQAQHLVYAQDPKACSVYISLAETKEKEHQLYLALSLYERALKLPIHISIKIDLLCRQGWIFEQLGDGRSCLHHFNEAYHKYLEEYKETSAETLLGVLAGYRLLGDLKQATHHIKELKSKLKKDDFVLPLFKARLSYYQGSIAFSQGNLLLCQQSHQKAIEQMEQLNLLKTQKSFLVYAQAWSGYGDALYALGQFTEAEKAMNKALQVAQQSHLGRLEVSTLHMLAIVNTYLGNGSKGLKLAELCHQKAMTVNDARALLFSELNMILPLLWAGQFTQAIPYCESAIQRVDWMSSQVLSGMSKAFIAYALYFANQTELAQTYSSSALKISEKQGTRLFGGVALGANILTQTVSKNQANLWVDQGLELLSQDVISHNYLYFSIGVIPFLYTHQDQPRLLRLSHQLHRFFEIHLQSASPPDCVIFLITWLDLILDLVQHDQNNATHITLDPIIKQVDEWDQQGSALFKTLTTLLKPSTSFSSL